MCRARTETEWGPSLCMYPYENAGKNMCVQMRAAHLFKRATACSTHSHTPSCMQEHAELLVRAVHALSAHSFMRAQFAS